MGKKLRSREACKILGIHRNTIVKWVDQGRLHPYRVSPTANRKYDEDELRRLLKEDEETETKPGLTAVYCRVSSAEQKTKGDLERQKLRVLEYCAEKHYTVGFVVDEVGSGLNDNRKKLLKLMRDAAEHKFNRLVIEHYDRLTRFNYNFLVEYFKSHGVVVEYVEEVLEESFEADLVKDMLSLITVFSAKLYGQRSKKNRKKSIKERYKKIAESEEFKQAYVGKSIGEVMEIEGM